MPHAVEDPRAACSGLEPATQNEIALVESLSASGALEETVGGIIDPRFCSTSDLGQTALRSFVWWRQGNEFLGQQLTEDGTYRSPLYPVPVAVDIGVVSQEAADRFLGGPRRSPEELKAQKRQLETDTALAAKQARQIQEFKANIGGDIGEAAGNVAAGVANGIGDVFGEAGKQLAATLKPGGLLVVAGLLIFGIYKVATTFRKAKAVATL